MIIFTLNIAGGNSTALVYSCVSKKKIIKELLREVEQIGFISKYKGSPKLTMMGEELCINATLAFASQLGKKGNLFTSGTRKSIKFENKGEFTKIEIDLNYKINNNIVLFEGIGFIFLKNKKQISKKYLSNLAKEYNLPAFGVIIYKKNKIEP